MCKNIIVLVNKTIIKPASSKKILYFKPVFSSYFVNKRPNKRTYTLYQPYLLIKIFKIKNT